MKVDDGVKHYSTKAEYVAAKTGGAAVNNAPIEVKDKLDLSSKEEVKEKAGEVKEKVKEAAKKPLSTGNSLVQAATKLVGDAKSAVLNNIPKDIPFIKPPSVKEEIKVDPPKREVVDKPAIFFISGLHLARLSSDDGGIREMAKHIPDAQHFEWHEEDEVLEEIKKRPAYQPIVLVGHSLGGDAVVNLANKLNSMEHGFKNIDLLVTLDSVGFNNDIIPNNVAKNLNFIGNMDFFFNDGPNIARDAEVTEVINELRDEKHTSIDESSDVQQKIFLGISKVLGSTDRFNKLVEQTYQNFEKINKRAFALRNQ